MQYSAVQYENVRENKSWIDPLSLGLLHCGSIVSLERLHHVPLAQNGGLGRCAVTI